MSQNKSDFVHLHCHTEFSTLDGMPKVEEYVIKAGEMGMSSLALTEHGNMRSMYQLQIKTSQPFDYNGTKYDYSGLVKPIFGVEFYASLHDYRIKGVPDSEKARLRGECGSESEFKIRLKQFEDEQGFKKRFHILAFAKNQVGLQNLFLLNYLSWKDGYYYRPRIDSDLLFKHHEGIIITTACIGGVAPELILAGKEGEADAWMKKAKKVFGDDLYVEIQPHNLMGDKDKGMQDIKLQEIANKSMIGLAHRHKIKIVATNDCHYLNKDDVESHNVLLAINSHKSVNAEDAWTFGDTGFYMRNKDEMIESFRKNHPYISQNDIKVSLENTLEIAERCNSKLEIDRKKGILPVVNTKGMPEDEFIKKLCYRGWKEFRHMDVVIERYAKLMNISVDESWNIYKDRLEFELKRIKDLKFAKYFVIIWDLFKWARSVDIMVGPGRGSSSASLVCFLLGITSVDPILYNLYFERFLAPGRIDFPDIDMDFEDSRRKEIFKYLFNKYGEENVCQIGTVGRMKGKQALHDVARTMQIPPSETNRITKHIITRSSGDARASQSVEDSFKEFDVCIEYNKKYPDVLRHVKKLEGKARQVGIHAAGIQIADRPIHQIVPIEYRDAKDDQGNKERIKVAGLDWLECQGLGLVKLDVLGLRTLTILKSTLKQIKKRKDIDINLEIIDLADKDTLQGFTDGKFVGIFQFDSIGMTKTCEKLTFKSFEDVIALNALYRPGCISGDVKIMFQFGNQRMKTYKNIKDLYCQFNKAPLFAKNMKRNFQIISYDEKSKQFVKNKIIDIYKSGIKKCYLVKIQNINVRSSNKNIMTGELKLTKEHKILTLDRGWQETENLKYGDYILIKFHNLRIKQKNVVDFQSLARLFYRERCAICGYDELNIPLDVHHIDENNKNNNSENLIFVCPNHHREIEYGKYSIQYIKERQQINKLPNSFDNSFRWAKFLNLIESERCETYDIEMESPNNNFIAGGIVVHNSMRSGLATHYINRAIGKEKLKLLHPIYDDICKETYGVLVYQEQLIKCFRDIAGYNEATADELRKKIAKSAGVETLGKESDKFISGAVKNGMSESEANKLFENMAFFGSYAFNKAHAAAYGMIAFWGMFLKIHYPVEFFYALLRHEPEQSEILRFVSDARKNGLDVKTPDINLSDVQFKIVDEKTIISGLVDIKGCGIKASTDICEKQPFTSLHNFLEKVNRRQCHKGVILALVKAGAFRSLYPSIGAMIKNIVVERKKGEDEITVVERMMEVKEDVAENLYKQYDTDENLLDEEHQVKIMSLVCPIPPYKHKIEYYEKLDKYMFNDRTNMDLYINVDETYDNEIEHGEGGLHRKRGIFKGTLVDIKYNNVGDFHKEVPDEKEKKRIGWGKRYANVNIENTNGIKRINIDIDIFPTFRHIIDRGLQTPVIMVGNMLSFNEVIYADIIVDLDEFREIIESDGSMKDKYKKMNPWQRYLLRHPCSTLPPELKSNNTSLVDIKYNIRKGIRESIVLVTRVKWHWTKKGKKMAFIELEDETGYLSCIMWPEGVMKFSKFFQVGSILKLYIKKEDDDNFFIDDKRKIELVKRGWQLVGHIEGETSNKDIESKSPSNNKK